MHAPFYTLCTHTEVSFGLLCHHFRTDTITNIEVTQLVFLCISRQEVVFDSPQLKLPLFITALFTHTLEVHSLWVLNIQNMIKKDTVW